MKHAAFRSRFLALILAVVMAAAVLPLTAAAEAEDTTISFAIPAEWENWYDNGNNNYYYDYVRINFQRADETWDQITMNRAYRENGYSRYTTWSDENRDRPVYTVSFNAADVMGDTVKRIQFQILGYNYDTEESNTVLQSYEYDYEGGDKTVSDYNGKLFIKDVGAKDYTLGDYTVYVALPNDWVMTPYPSIKINANIKNTDNWHQWEMTSTGDYFEVNGELLRTWSIEFDPYELFGIDLEYGKLQFQWWKGSSWKNQLEWTDGSAAGINGKVFYKDCGEPVTYVPTQPPIPESMTVYFAKPTWWDTGESGTIKMNVGYPDDTEGGHWKQYDMTPTGK